MDDREIRVERSFNWTPVIIIGVILLLGAAIVYAVNAELEPLRQFQADTAVVLDEIDAISEDELRQQAKPVGAIGLSPGPQLPADTWVSCEAVIVSHPDGDTEGTFSEMPGLEQGCAYMTTAGVMVIDTSRETPVASDGDRIRAYGRVITFDLRNIPLVGKEMARD